MIGAGKYTDTQLECLIATTDLIGKKLADTEWLCVVLHFLDADDEIFRPNYYYQKPRNSKPVRAQAMALLDNSDGFFNDLPELDQSKMKGRRMYRLGKN